MENEIDIRLTRRIEWHEAGISIPLVWSSDGREPAISSMNSFISVSSRDSVILLTPADFIGPRYRLNLNFFFFSTVSSYKSIFENLLL